MSVESEGEGRMGAGDQGCMMEIARDPLRRSAFAPALPAIEYMKMILYCILSTEGIVIGVRAIGTVRLCEQMKKEKRGHF